MRRRGLDPDDGHERQALPRAAAEVVGERQPSSEGGRGQGALLGRFAAQLQPALEQHPQPRGPDRMPEGLQPAVRIHRQGTVPVEGAVQGRAPGLPRRRKTEVLHQHQLGDREAVVHLRQRQFGPRVGDPGLPVGVRGRVPDLGKGGEVVLRVGGAGGRADGERERLHEQRPVGVAVGVLGPYHQCRRRAVAHPRAVEDAQLTCHPRGLAEGLPRHRPAEVRPRVQRAVGVVLPRDPVQHVAQRPVGQAVLLPVRPGEQAEGGRRGEVGFGAVAGDGGGRKPGHAGVLELLHPDGHRRVVRAARHRVAGVAQCVRAHAAQ